jgi:hypothetical protein
MNNTRRELAEGLACLGIPEGDPNKAKVTYYTHIKWIPRRKPCIPNTAPEALVITYII